jgi:hypothetical protein
VRPDRVPALNNADIPCFLYNLVRMNPDERSRTEAAMAKISRMKKAIEADPAAAMRASIDASMTNAKRRLNILFCVAIVAAAAIAIYLRGRG